MLKKGRSHTRSLAHARSRPRPLGVAVFVMGFSMLKHLSRRLRHKLSAHHLEVQLFCCQHHFKTWESCVKSLSKLDAEANLRCDPLSGRGGSNASNVYVRGKRERGRRKAQKQEEVAPNAVMPKQRQRVIMSKNDGPYLQSWQQRHANGKQFETRKSLPAS